MVDIESVLSTWRSCDGMGGPLPKAVRLWGSGGYGIWVSDTLGPAVPYLPVDHGNGTFNHGYVRLKGVPGAAAGIPEAQDWKELQAFLETVNASGSPIKSVGCEKAYFPGEEGMPPVKLGSYLDVVFTEVALNDRPENLLMLATCLARAVEGCENWWADVSFALQRMRVLASAKSPWGPEVSIKNYGRSEDEARKFWGVTLARLGMSVAKLPVDFHYVG
jgi:hypothetical protein